MVKITRLSATFALLIIEGVFMHDDERCCGTGTCIIDAQGACWCGQVWDGEKMCHPVQTPPLADAESPLK